MTLYLTLGGRPAIRQAVAAVLTEPMPEAGGGTVPAAAATAADDLTEFLVFLFGGAPIYEGPPISHTLAPYCADPGGYDRFVDRLARHLVGRNLPVRVEAELRVLLERVRRHVVGASCAAQMTGPAAQQTCA
ncbi:hypothetical protein [Polymorphum gilvum]|uniref:ATP-dependent Clp protease proteolytic subunit n=1 Tax=Polymorphum gilvum (strain LMG 25793 / CGMCC 1.9160 / SL003B-26A1) TaxID=991905 RepID=F2IV10_POLGS|nr:hypothetical protein [Polymorphum gilvum]ADZ70239.1 ATP-dependent Clp protease proteolytic subunit [Polymorphum gilvum SL003B-26A1]